MVTDMEQPGIYARYAPSPTGFLHLGNALSALICYRDARDHQVPFLVRIEDIDRDRCRPQFEAAIYDDLAWLGLDWSAGPVRRQSDHLKAYETALAQLRARDLVYPCFCTRAQIQREIDGAVSAPHGPLGVIYPGTCRNLSADERQARLDVGDKHAWRLDMAKAMTLLPSSPLTWRDHLKGEIVMTLDGIGDPVLGRKDNPASYHLAVVIDDGLQQIGRVTRGEDLFHATHLHRLLQFLFDLPTPVYHHHHLVLDENGKRLAKRYGAATLQHFRQEGGTLDALKARIGFTG